MNAQHALPVIHKAPTVMLIDDVATLADTIAPLLSQEGYDLVSRVHAAPNLYAELRVCNPEIIVINTETLSPIILDFLVAIEVNNPKPVALFIATLTQQEITLLIELGISSIVVGRFNKSRLKSIIDIALARFHHAQSHPRGHYAS
jgi:two-component system, response regulator / RNA-binding antiterminator